LANNDVIKNVRSWSIILTLFIALWTSATAIAGPGDVVKIGMRYDTSTASIIQMKHGNDIAVIMNMHESLITTDPLTGNRVPLLAKTIEVLENGKKLHIVLNEGSLFHTGDPVTAHDVKFTYDQCVNPKNANLISGALDEIEEITVTDDHTLTFEFWEPVSSWKDLLWVGICSKKYFERVGAEAFHKKPVGSGPFEFVERRVGESFTLKAADNHYGKLVDYEILKFITIPDDVSRLAMLETGELDLVSDIMPHQLRHLKKNKRIKIKTISQVPSLFGMSTHPLHFPIMKDKKVKQAINHAINRQEMVDKLFLGKGYPLYLFANVSELGHDPDYVVEFNPEKAKALLKESSYKPGTPLTMSYTSDVPNASLVAASVQKYCEEIGLTIRLQKLEIGTKITYTRKRDKRLGAMGLFSWAGGRDPNLRLKLTSLSNGMFAAYTDRYNKEEYDALIIAQGREMNLGKRLAILARFHELSQDDPGSINLFGLDMIYAMTDRIEYSWVPNESFVFNVQSIKIVK
jgi:peptide/nickel transport system substrate-binding protein